jgi:hypothetical protein
MKRSLKWSGVLTLLLLFCLIQVASAAPQAIYGPTSALKTFGTKHSFSGYFSASGLEGRQTRGSWLRWHDVRYKNEITGQVTSNYEPTTTFDLIESEPGDNFNRRRGYHAIYEDEATIKMMASKFNGNADFVWRMISKARNGIIPNSYPAKYALTKEHFFEADIGFPYVHFGTVGVLSGGGNFKMVATGNGVDTPLFQTTYTYTPWPTIQFATPYDGLNPSQNVSLGLGKLKFNATTYTSKENRMSVWIVKGNVTQSQILTELKDGEGVSVTLADPQKAYRVLNNYGSGIKINTQQDVPVDKFKHLLKLDGSVNDMTLVVSDPNERIAVMPFKIAVVPSPDLECACGAITIDPPAPREPGQPATIKVKVINHYDKPIAQTQLYWKWQTDTSAKKVDIYNLQPHEERIIEINTVYPYKSMNFVVNLNPNRNMPSNESNWNNNRCEYYVRVGLINLKALDIRVNPMKPQVGNKVVFDVLVENQSETENVPSTALNWWVNGELQTRPTEFSLAPKEQRWITDLEYPLVPNVKELKVRAFVNPDKDSPPNEKIPGVADPWKDNVIEKTFPVGNTQLNYYMKSISGGTYAYDAQITTVVRFGRQNLMADENKPKTTHINLYVLDSDGNYKKVGTKSVTLDGPGQEKTDSFTWDSSGLEPGNYTLIATINLDPVGESEITWVDNTIYTGLTIMPIYNPPWCKSSENHTSDISGTETVCDADGNCWTIYYYEYLNASFRNGEIVGTFVDESADEIDGTDVPLVKMGRTIKAGQGFTFEINSRYSEDRDMTGNIYRATATFARPDGTQETIELVPVSQSRNFVRWGLPLAWVSKHGDEVIYDESGNPGSNNPEDDNYYYPGGRAYYTSLNQPNGRYHFKVNVYARGVNELTQCLEGEIDVEKTLMNDFYVRQVIPEDPFPEEHFSEPSPLWKDNLDVFDNLIDWYNYLDGTRDWPVK